MVRRVGGKVGNKRGLREGGWWAKIRGVFEVGNV